MSVEFNEPPAMSSVRPSKSQSWFTRLVIQTGVVKTETGAQTVLLIIAFLILAAAVFFFIRANEPVPVPSAEQVVI